MSSQGNINGITNWTGQYSIGQDMEQSDRGLI
jgi:hypothetical protein